MQTPSHLANSGLDPSTLDSVRTELVRQGAGLSEAEFYRAFDVAAASSLALFIAAARPVSALGDLPESCGIASFLIHLGWEPIWARSAAAIAVKHGRRRAAECKLIGPAYAAIRFLARPKTNWNSARSRARLLLETDQTTSIIANLFGEAGLQEHEFLDLLGCLVNRLEGDPIRLREIAVSLLPHLSLPRGPKVSAASASYEFLLNIHPELRNAIWPQDRLRGREHVDALTRAIRLEFDVPSFDSRPARRRMAHI